MNFDVIKEVIIILLFLGLIVLPGIRIIDEISLSHVKGRKKIK